MDSSDTIKSKMSEIVLESIGGYNLTPLVLEMIRFLLKGIYEGLILINKHGKIEFMDKYTERFFNLNPGEGRNFYITDLIPGSEADIVAKTGIPAIGQVQEVKGEKKIVQRLPIKKDGEIIGVISKVIFHKVEEIENLNNEIENLKIQINQYKKGVKEINSTYYTFDNLLGISEKFLKVKQMAMRVAITDANILLEGESGVGKELFAQSIHNLSRRRAKSFIRVNCPSIPYELAESELFGYEKGAFTGARNEGKLGKFELSEGGTIFLDEVGSLPLNIQSKLLRVLQEREIERLGGRNTIKLNFHLIAATNVSLGELVKIGRFRSDVFHRLNTVSISIPPLRERKEDIPVYIDHFLKEINKSLSTNIKSVSHEALRIIMNYSWPGNIRELTNVLEQSVINVSKGHIILPEHLPTSILKMDHHMVENRFSLKCILEETESQAIKRVLDITKGNKRKAAKLLDIQRSVLYHKLKKYNTATHRE